MASAISSTPRSSPISSPSCMTPRGGSPILEHPSLTDCAQQTCKIGSSIHLSSSPPSFYLGDDSDIYYKPGAKISPATMLHVKAEREKVSKRYLPYPPVDMVQAAPLELRFAARFIGQGCQPEFTNEAIKQHEQKLDCGLSTLSSLALLKVFKAKQAAREAARTRVLLTAWEIEESMRFTSFLDTLFTENQQHLTSLQSEVENIKTEFSVRSLGETRDDAGYLQAVYDDQVKMFQTIDAQAEKIGEILDSRGQPSADSVAESAISVQLASFLNPGSSGRLAATSGTTNTSTFGGCVDREVQGRGRAPLDIDDDSSDEGDCGEDDN